MSSTPNAPAAVPVTTPPYTCSNDHDNRSHGGIPIGAVQISTKHCESFQALIKKALRASTNGTKTSANSLNYRGVQPFVGPRNQQQPTTKMLLLHIPPAVATAFDDGHPQLTAFLEQHDGVYIPGLRRSRLERAAIRPRKSANLPAYKPPTANNNNTADADAAEPVKKKAKKGPTFQFSELFAGIGGFRIGLESIGGECVFANEMDPYAAYIYRHAFGDDSHFLEADILDICANRDVPADVDILTAGFPCQPFSTRGKQRGLNDERGQLYREIVRVLRASRPKSFMFENVAGLVSMGSEGSKGRYPVNGDKAGPVFQTVLEAFEECGYDVTWYICNSRHYVAQQRHRVYIVGMRKDLDLKKKYSWDWYEEMRRGASSDDANTNSISVRDIMEHPDSPAVAESELSPEFWAKLQEVHSEKHEGAQYASLDLDAKSPTLISSYRRSGSHTSKFVFIERDGTKREAPSRPRYLTPRECCRIQGFPDDYVIPYINHNDDAFTAHFYSGIGNAVVPPLVANVGKEIMACLRSCSP